MSTDPGQAEVPPQTTPPPAVDAGAANAGASAPPHPAFSNITFTFPIIFLSNLPRQSSSDNNDTSDNGAQNVFAPEEFQNLFTRFLQAMPSMAPFTPGQFEPAPNGPPKKHATESALDSLKPVDVTSLPEGERRCHICMQDFYTKPVGPRSPYVEDVKEEVDEDNGDVEETVAKEEGEVPLQMPCSHVFGSVCLKEWLYQSPTCPLCREEVESYTDDPQPSSIPAFGAFDGPIPWFQVPNPPPPPSTEQSDEMQVETPSTDTTNPTQPQFRAHVPRLAFQFIFTTPSSSTPANQTSSPNSSQPPPPRTTTPAPSPNPNISRPSSAHTVRHHPYARTPTPSPLSGPSVADRPDLFCAQRASGLCPHDITDEDLIRLECGHAFHPDCLQESMVIGDYPVQQNERRCPRCRRWANVLQ